MRVPPFLLAAGVLVLWRSQPAGAAPSGVPLRGADAVLDEVLKLSAVPAPGGPPAAPGADALAARLVAFREDVARFDGAALAPEEAAKGWLGLFDRWETVGRNLAATGGKPPVPSARMRRGGVRGNRDLPNFHTLLEHLPPPAAWPALTAGLQSRAETATASSDGGPARGALLAALAAALRDDEAALDAGTTRLAAVAKPRSDFASVAAALRGRLLRSTDDPERVARLFLALLPPARGPENRSSAADAENGAGTGELDVPDLVTLVGERRAGELLREALRRPVGLKTEHAGERTTTLARQLALEMTDELAVPQWELADSLEAGALFEALERRFVQHQGAPVPVASRRDFMSRSDLAPQQAGAFYTLGLIAHGRVEDAVAFVKKARAWNGDNSSVSMPYGAIQAMRALGRSREVYEFLTRLLAEHLALASWDTYLSLAADVSRLDDVIALTERALASPDLPADERANISKRLADAYLAADRIDDGVRLRREKLVRRADHADGNENADSSPDSLATAGVELARLGQLLGRTDLFEEGLRAALANLDAAQPPATVADDQSYHGSSTSRTAPQVAALLTEIGREAEAEDVLRGQLLADTRRESAQRRQQSAMYQGVNVYAGMPSSMRRRMMESSGQLTHMTLLELAGFYGRLGRSADVLALLDRAPEWNAADLGPILKETTEDNTPLGFIAARALADEGRTEEARRVLRGMFDGGAAWDSAFELFTRITPPAEALRDLDALTARDPFEERPLIWRAETLLRLGRLEEAETAARAAIAVDPSDGEQGRGRRMQAYTTLANVLSTRGKEADAVLPRAAVRAIRLSEDADRLHAAGLLTRAVAMYDQALGLFSDAYCIQSRIAVQLVALGRTEEAEAHYQRAFELMPESFGRVESHCFGCEGAFNGQSAQSTAEKVFTRLAAQPAARPQVFYLLGYLRKEQGRYAEALVATRRAVQRDPDYLNAWKRIEDLGRNVHVPRAVADEAQLNVLRLDPNNRHGGPDLPQAHDLAALWTTVANVQGRLAPAPGAACYPLAASAAQRAETSRAAGFPLDAEADDGEEGEGEVDGHPRSPRTFTPAAVVSRQDTLQDIARGLDATVGASR